MKLFKKVWLLAGLLTLALCLSACQKSDEAKYKDAQSLMGKGQYAEAAAAFEELGSYEEAAKMVMYCKAADAGEKGDYSTAISTFELLGDFKESTYMETYYTARQYEDTADQGTIVYWGRWISAAKTYDSIRLFRDSKDRAEKCRKTAYDSAVKWAESGDYDGAIRVLDALESYSDSATLSKYYSAYSLEKNGSYVEASSVFAKLGDYKNAKEQATLVMQRGYDAASKLEETGDQIGAYNAFIALGDYKDAFERACKPFYAQGEALRKEQKWDEAVAAFTQAGKYSDAETQIAATRYIEGEIKRTSQDWDGAVEAFALAGEYNDAATQVLATRYEEGKSKLDSQDWNGAVKAFEQAGRYEDARTKVKEVRYAEGTWKREKKDWKGAVDAFLAAGYSVKSDVVLETYYLQGLSLMEEKKWDRAVDAFKSAANYKDSSEQIKEAKYQKAGELREKGSGRSAYQTYLQIRDYKDVMSIINNDEVIINARQGIAKDYQKVSGLIKFGRYEQDGDTSNGKELISWYILEVQGNKILLLSKDGIIVSKYGTDQSSWSNCTIRTMLNGTFLNSFTEEQKKCIIPTKIQDNYTGTYTEDKVFIMSSSEYDKYFRSSSEYYKRYIICELSVSAKKERDSNDVWLRDVEHGVYERAGIYLTDVNKGIVYSVSKYYGTGYHYNDMRLSKEIEIVRPMMWIDIETDFDSVVLASISID